MQSKASRQALKLALIYIIAAGGWILFSDEFLQWLGRDPDARTWISIYKGWTFVLVTGGLLYLTIRRLLRNWEREEEQRKEAAAALVQSEMKLHAILDASPIPMALSNEQKSITFLNPAFVRTFGYTQAEIPTLAEWWPKAYPDPAYLQRVAEAWNTELEHVKQTKAAFSPQEATIRCGDGTNKTVRACATPLGDSFKDEHVVVFFDITAQRQAEASLRDSEERYRHIFELESDALVLVDAETHRFVEVNQSAQQLYGYSREEFLQMHLEAISAEPEETRVAVGAGSVFVPLRWHRKKNGEPFVVEITASFIEYQGHRRKLIAIRDITVRQQAMDQLREAATQLLEAQRIGKLGSYVLDVASGRWTSSTVMDELFGIADAGFTKDLAGWLEIVHPDDRAGLQLYWDERVLKQKVGFDRTYRIVRQNDRQERTVHGRGKLILDDDGQVSKMAGIIQDITERQQAEAALRESEEKFRSLFNNAEVGMFRSKLDGLELLDANEKYLSMLGRTREETVGKPSANLWADSKEREKMFRLLKATNRLGTFECKILKKTGDVMDCLTSLACNPETGILEGSITDITEHKRAEAALRESERFNHATLDALGAHVAVLDEQGNILATNRAWREFAGANTTDWKAVSEGVNYLTACEASVARGDRDASEALKGIREVAGSARPDWFHEYPCHSPNEERWFYCRATRFPGEGPVRVVVAHENITERKRAEAALRGSEEQFRAIFELASIGMAQADPRTGRWLRVNQKMCAITGYSADELLGMRIPDITHSEDRQKDWEAFQQVIRSESPDYRMEKRYVRKDGTVVWVNVNMTVIRDADGQPVRTMAAIEDITGRRRAEEQVQVQFSALTAAANAIVITDGKGKIEWANPAYTKLTGYSTEEAIGGNLRMLKSGRHPPGFYANLWATIMTGNVWHGEMINKHKDGRLYTEEMTITPVRGADGKFAHFVAIKQDVTERRGLELQLQQAQKMEAIGTLAGGIAHDFNNILAAMFGYAYLLKQDPLEKPAREYVGEILKAANRAKELVQQILTFSRQREFERQIIQLHIVVKEAMKFLRASMPASIKIETNFAPDTPTVLADPTQIYQVVTNLATNALHAMEDRPGRLTVSLEPFQPDEAFIRLHPKMKPIPYSRLTVADTGHGIDVGTLERIFEPFFTTKPVGKGTGLGLSVVHGILQAHEGAITVESEVGRGTTFTLYFPGRTMGTTVAEAEAKNAPGGRGQKILLLDDEPALTAVMQSLLARLNYKATTSNSARNAIGLCRESPARFDLVITDLTMPELNGLEVARQIRAIRPDMPVILISGFSVELSREDLLAAGICELLKKPITLNQLAEAVQGALNSNDRRPPPACQSS